MKRPFLLVVVASGVLAILVVTVVFMSGSDDPSVGSPPNDGGTPGPSATPPTVVPNKVARVLNKLTDPGRILYNPPTEMREGATEVVEVRITRDSVARLNEDLIGTGPPVEEDIPVANAMIVDLVSPDFEIIALSPRRQLVGGRPFNEWIWQVSATRSGAAFLLLTVSIDVPSSSGIEGLSPVVLRREIEVAVDPVYKLTHFVGANWQAILASLVAIVTLLFGSGLISSIRKRRDRSSA